jgi:hypothetical protein|tara:strand:+ start:521 stop:1087 length:567 start_codon:yes stop_codon:yes gene_type:complete
MKIKYLQYPFYHTIIYNVFSKTKLESMITELTSLTEVYDADDHHKNLKIKNNTEPFCIDRIYDKDRSKSTILNYTSKHFRLKYNGDLNPFLNYLPLTNQDTTFVQKYYNGASYQNHNDFSVLTFLYLMNVEKYNGGQLVFTKYDYMPNLKHNSCLIFPSYEYHKVNKVISKTKKAVRYSINRRLYIKG